MCADSPAFLRRQATDNQSVNLDAKSSNLSDFSVPFLRSAQTSVRPNTQRTNIRQIGKREFLLFGFHYRYAFATRNRNITKDRGLLRWSRHLNKKLSTTEFWLITLQKMTRDFADS